VYVEPSSVRRQRRSVLSGDGHVVDMPPVPQKHAKGKLSLVEMRGGSHILGSLPLALHLQEEVSKWFLHSLVSCYTLLTPQGFSTSLNCMFSFAGNKDRSDAKQICLHSKDEDQEDDAS
jgi:hypothetical protein